VLERACSIAKVIGGRDTLDKDAISDIEGELWSLFHDLVKIVGFSAGHVHGFDGQLESIPSLLRNPEEAREEFLLAAGLIDETSAMADRRHVAMILNLITPLLDGLPGENRTRIHELLREYQGKSKVIRRIADLTESVSMGELAWGEYRVILHALIETECLPHTQN
jgi:hypothetical protein